MEPIKLVRNKKTDQYFIPLPKKQIPELRNSKNPPQFIRIKEMEFIRWFVLDVIQMNMMVYTVIVVDIQINEKSITNWN